MNNRSGVSATISQCSRKCREAHTSGLLYIVSSPTGNRTPGIAVTGRDVTNYTIGDTTYMLCMLHPGFEPGLPRPQRGVLTTRLMELETDRQSAEIKGMLSGYMTTRLTHTMIWYIYRARLAQSVEHWSNKPTVAGSIPVASIYNQQTTIVYLH